MNALTGLSRQWEKRPLIKPRLFARRVVQTILVLVGALGEGIAEAGPGDQILRYPFPATSVFALIDVQPSVAVGVNGDFVVVWTSHVQGVDQGIWGRRFGRDGAPQGDQFRVSPPHSNISPQDEAPAIAMDLDGDLWSCGSRWTSHQLRQSCPSSDSGSSAQESRKEPCSRLTPSPAILFVLVRR